MAFSYVALLHFVTYVGIKDVLRIVLIPWAYIGTISSVVFTSLVGLSEGIGYMR